MRRFRFLLALPLLLALGGCNFVVLHPAGDIAWQQRDLLIVSTLLMLIVIIPVMALTVLFAWRYRQGNKTATYRPKWDHSIELELVIWGAPLLIIICLGALTWMDTHLLDPYRPLSRVAKGQPVAEKTEFTVKLEKYDAANKIKVIKEVRAITGLGLKEVSDATRRERAHAARRARREARTRGKGRAVARQGEREREAGSAAP